MGGHPKIKSDKMPDWIYDPKETPLDYRGFVYLITNLVTGQMYVGRKYTWVERKKKITKESDWKTYWGSSEHLKADIEKLGVENFKREILIWCTSTSETNYEEVAEQFRRNVLTARLPDGTPAYYNRSILSRYYARTIESYSDPVSIQKLKDSLRKHREQPEYVHPMKGKKPKVKK